MELLNYLYSLISTTLTLNPATALPTIAIPVPIYPAPTTPKIVENLYLRNYFIFI